MNTIHDMMMRTGCTLETLLRAADSTGLKGRVTDGSRQWTEAEATNLVSHIKQIQMAADNAASIVDLTAPKKRRKAMPKVNRPETPTVVEAPAATDNLSAAMQTEVPVKKPRKRKTKVAAGAPGVTTVNVTTVVAEAIAEMSEKDLVEKLASVLWSGGDINTPYCQQKLAEAGLKMADLTPAQIHRAQEINDSRWQENFKGMNDDPNSRLKAVVVGNATLDPALNPNHPVKGAAKQLEVIRNAGNSTAVEQPTKTSKPNQPKPETSVNEPKKPRARYQILGHPGMSVIRWMGMNGFTREEAEKVLKHFECNCAPASIGMELRDGATKTFRYGKAAELTPAQAAEVKAIVGK